MYVPFHFCISFLRFVFPNGSSLEGGISVYLKQQSQEIAFGTSSITRSYVSGSQAPELWVMPQTKSIYLASPTPTHLLATAAAVGRGRGDNWGVHLLNIAVLDGCLWIYIFYVFLSCLCRVDVLFVAVEANQWKETIQQMHLAQVLSFCSKSFPNVCLQPSSARCIQDDSKGNIPGHDQQGAWNSINGMVEWTRSVGTDDYPANCSHPPLDSTAQQNSAHYSQRTTRSSSMCWEIGIVRHQ